MLAMWKGVVGLSQLVGVWKQTGMWTLSYNRIWKIDRVSEKDTTVAPLLDPTLSLYGRFPILLRNDGNVEQLCPLQSELTLCLRIALGALTMNRQTHLMTKALVTAHTNLRQNVITHSFDRFMSGFECALNLRFDGFKVLVADIGQLRVGIQPQITTQPVRLTLANTVQRHEGNRHLFMCR